jgi:hypothetical protein
MHTRRPFKDLAVPRAGLERRLCLMLAGGCRTVTVQCGRRRRPRSVVPRADSGGRRLVEHSDSEWRFLEPGSRTTIGGRQPPCLGKRPAKAPDAPAAEDPPVAPHRGRFLPRKPTQTSHSVSGRKTSPTRKSMRFRGLPSGPG